MRKAFKSEAMAAIHESMADLHKIGAIDDETMREFDRIMPSPATEPMEELKELGQEGIKTPPTHTEN